jgi:glutathione S-transferase
VLDGGEILIDSAAILDWLDETVGPERALLPRSGAERRRALRQIALATGAIDKAGAATYERVIRPAAYRFPDWIERCRTQATGAIEALAAEAWAPSTRLDQAQITAACMIRYVRMADPELMPTGRCPTLDALSERLEARPEFRATYPAEYAIPRAE